MKNKINFYEEYLKIPYSELLELFKEAKDEDEKNFYINLVNYRLAQSCRKYIENEKY